MTEGELGELLRATAAAVITGETLGITPAHEPDASEVLPVAQAEHVPTASAFDDEPLPSLETQWLAAARSEPEPLARRTDRQLRHRNESTRRTLPERREGASEEVPVKRRLADAGDIAGRERNGARVRGPASGASEGLRGKRRRLVRTPAIPRTIRSRANCPRSLSIRLSATAQPQRIRSSWRVSIPGRSAL